MAIFRLHMIVKITDNYDKALKRALIKHSNIITVITVIFPKQPISDNDCNPFSNGPENNIAN